MTACPASPHPVALVLLAVLAAGPAFGQGAPLLLVPPGREAPRPAVAPAAPDTASPAPRGPAGIEIENARPLDTEGVGLIDAGSGGLAADAWTASNRPFAERLVRDLPAPIASTPARALATRALVSASGAPQGTGGANFAALRALKLRQLGDIGAAADLAGRIPQRTGDENLLRILIDEAWLAGADERACGHVREALAVSRHADFQKALMFCQALAGDSNRAQLGLAMLRDQGVPEDAAFVTLLLAAGGDGRGVKVDSLRNASPLSLAMLRAAKVAPPADAAQSSDPAVLASLAKGSLGTPEFRLAAGERAEAFGALPSEALGELYAAIELSPAQLADAPAFARQDGGPKGRAALYKAAKAAVEPAQRLAALQRLWRHGRERGGYATLARVGLGLLADVPAAPEHAAAAGDVARALLMAGREDMAMDWMRFARAAQIGGGADAETQVAGFWLLATLGGLPWDGPRDPAKLDAWRQAQERIDARAAPARAALGVTLLSGLGHLPPGGAVIALAQGPFERLSVPLPSPVLWTGLHEAAIGGRSAETALLAVHLLGAEGAAGASPYALLAVLDGLRAVGFEETARRLALEAAIASGL
jgi:hypothetical protein